MANVSLPIFAGFKVKYGIESAQFLEKAAQMDADNDRQGVVLNTIAAYVNLYKAGAAVKLVEENWSDLVLAYQTLLQKAGLLNQ